MEMHHTCSSKATYETSRLLDFDAGYQNINSLPFFMVVPTGIIGRNYFPK